MFEAGGSGLQRWGSFVTVGGCTCCAEGLGLAVGKGRGHRTPPSLPSWSLRCTAAHCDGTPPGEKQGTFRTRTWEKGQRPAMSLA